MHRSAQEPPLRAPALVCYLIAGVLAGATMPASAAVTERVCRLQVDVDLAACAAAEDAVAACTSALEQRPTDFNARASLCEAYAARGDHAAAIGIMEAGKSVHRSDEFTLGLIDRVLSNVTEAQSTGQTRGADVGTLVEYMVLRCTMIKNLQNCDEALAIDPENVQALAGRGDILAGDGNLAGAIQAYRNALAVSPDLAEVRGKLDNVLAERQQQVSECLAATAGAGIDTCQALLMPGEPDAYDIYSKIGSLQLAAGNLNQALDAYRDADSARASPASGETVEILTLARDCMARNERGICSRALDRVPDSQMFRSVRAGVALSGCRALASAGGTEADTRAVCEQARTLDRSAATAQEVDRLLASLAAPATPPAASEVPPQAPPPDYGLTRQCLARVAAGDTNGDTIVLCEQAAQNEAAAPAAADVVLALARLQAQRDADRAVTQCESAIAGAAPADAVEQCRGLLASVASADSRGRIETLIAGIEYRRLADLCNNSDDSAATVTYCRDALSRAVSQSDRLGMQRRIDQIEQQLASANALASLRDRCINFASAVLGTALTDCRSAAEQLPDDADIQRALQTVEGLAASYRNEPIIWAAGTEAITY
jgi:tetratricopeptide (TPR) repeat protein